MLGKNEKFTVLFCKIEILIYTFLFYLFIINIKIVLNLFLLTTKKSVFTTDIYESNYFVGNLLVFSFTYFFYN